MSHWSKSAQAEWDRREQRAEFMRMEAEIERLTQALRDIVDHSSPETPYSWCQSKLKDCHAIAEQALRDRA